jgi:phosphoglycerate dehydrogenase-like enzyme
MKKNILVLYESPAEVKQIYQEILGDLAQVYFIKEEPKSSRAKLLDAAAIVIALSFSPEEIDPTEIPRLRNVRFIQLLYAGADKIPFGVIPEYIILASNVGAFAKPIAEHVLALALALAKNLLPKIELLKNGIFDRSGFNQELRGSVCGIIGFGGNGREIAKAMQAVGLRVLGINRSGSTDFPVDFIGSIDDMKKVLEQSDVVVVATPLTRQTKDLIGERELGWMKENAMLINVGRGDVINQKALYEHLQTHPGFRAGIDTWWSEPAGKKDFELDYPFFELPNIIGSPHCADHVPRSMPHATRCALDNVKNFLLGYDLRGVLNRDDYLK